MASTDGNGQGPPQQQSGPQQQVPGQNGAGQMQAQVQQQQQPQQIQLQQAATAQAIHGAQQHQQQQQVNQTQQMQQVQLISSPQQYNLQGNLANFQQLLNQGQILVPGNFINPNMNPQIQVITKPIQNQFTTHMLPGTTSYAIPTSGGSNNSVGQQYIISNFSPTSPLQIQHQQGKPGEMPKMIGAQLQQGLWPQTLFTTGGQNSFLIRGTHPEQMYIQPQMTSNATSQHFSMQPLQSNTGQLTTTSIAPAPPTSTQVQQTIQQGTLQHQQQQQQNQQQQPQAIQPQPNVISVKTPANLQPKPPPLQIQPNTQQQQQTHQLQHQHQLQQQFQVTMTQPNQQQIQMIPQATTASMIPQSISISQSQATQVLQQAQQQQQQQQNNQQQQQQPRLTLIPQGNQIQNQSIQIIPQPQAIRPNFTTTAGVTVMTSQAPATAQQPTTTNGLQLSQPRQKVRKSTPRGGSAGPGSATTVLQPPRTATTIISVPNPQQKQFQQQQQQNQTNQNQVNQQLARLPVTVTSQPQQQPQQMVSHLKTINISAIQPNLPDATITPLIPQGSQPQQQQQQQQQSNAGQSMPPALQVFTTQVPSPNISITPAPPPVTQNTPKKDEAKEEVKGHDQKANEIEKENKLKAVNGVSNGEEAEEVSLKQKLPKAMVKPQVLTHVIEGFVIQEASEPFPMPKHGEVEEPPKKKSAMSGEMGKCEMCGKVDLKAKFKKNKRFCSSQCAKGMKAAQQQAQATSTNSHGNQVEEKKKNRGRKWGDTGMDFTDETSSSVDDTSANDEPSAMEVEESRVNPVKWGVSEVVDFVKSLPGCSEYADDFAVQEIDGQALLLLKEDHLMSAIGMKLGPALKLCAKIEGLRSGGNGSSSDGVAK